MPDKLNKLKELLKLVDESLTRKEFVEAFKSIISQIAGLEKKLVDRIDKKIADAKNTLENLQELHREAIRRVEDENKSTISNFRKWVIKQVNTLFIKSKINEKVRELDEKLKQADEKIAQVKSGVDGYIPIKGKDYFDGKDGSPDNPVQIRDKLEQLKGKERLDVDAIDGLQEKLDKFKKVYGRPIRFGGGLSKMAVDRHILDPYTPTTVSSTVYTLKKIPNPATSLKVFRGGQKQQLTTDYTVSGKTLTLLVALVSGEILEVEHRI